MYLQSVHFDHETRELILLNIIYKIKGQYKYLDFIIFSEVQSLTQKASKINHNPILKHFLIGCINL